MKIFQDSQSIIKIWTTQAFDHVNPKILKQIFELLSVSDFEFDPKNGFRVVKLARGDFYTNQSTLKN